jgi:hypothetical protein
MSKQVDDLMALADVYADWAEAKGKGHPTYAESRQALQSALEAALGQPQAVPASSLKLGEPQIPQAWLWQFSDGDWHDVPFATQDECEHECAGYNGKAHPLFLAAPPAQTPEKQKHQFVLWAEYEARIEALQNEAAFHKALSEKAMQSPPVTFEITRLKSVIEDMLLASAAPPAQTPPPRLTDDEVIEIAKLGWWKSDSDITSDGLDIARAIETAVRAQFGVQE